MLQGLTILWQDDIEMWTYEVLLPQIFRMKYLDIKLQNLNL